MNCPVCDKKMKQTYHDTLNYMTCEEIQECECGVTYEFSYGAERYTKNGEKLEIE